MNQHKYKTKGKLGSRARSPWSWDEIVKQIAENGISVIKDVSYANNPPFKTKSTQKLERLELLKLWKAVEAFNNPKSN